MSAHLMDILCLGMRRSPDQSNPQVLNSWEFGWKVGKWPQHLYFVGNGGVLSGKNISLL